MTGTPSVPIAPRRIALGSIFHAGYAGVAWIIRQVFFAGVWASTLFGLFFALLCFGSGLPMFSRQVIFHPGIVLWLKVGFALIVAIYLLWVLITVMIGFAERMAEHYPILGKIGVGLLLLLMVSLLVFLMNTPAQTPQSLQFVRRIMPPDRVLLHMQIATKSPTRASAVLPNTPLPIPPLPIPPWTTTDIVGTATVKSLGHGRYEIQMIQPPRIARHQG